MKEVAVILLVYRNLELVKDCVSKLKLQSLRPGVIVVWNERGGGVDLEVNDGVLEIYNEGNLGYAGGCNKGIRLALERGYQYAMLLNVDTIFSRSLISNLVNNLTAQPKLGAIAPILLEGGVRYAGGRDMGKYLQTRIAVGDTTSQLSYLPGTALLFRLSLMPHVGYLDERYFFSGEVADFCVRMKQKGYALDILANEIIKHEIGDTESVLRRTLYRYYSVRNRFLYIHKHFAGHRLYWKAIWVIRIIRQIGGAILDREWASARALMLAISDGLLGRFGDANHTFL